MHRYIKGDVVRYASGIIIASLDRDKQAEEATLLRTAREEWDARHPLGPEGYRMRDWTCGSSSGEADGDPPVVTYCILCGPRPAEPRSAEEIEAMRWREPKAEPPQMLLHPQHMRDLTQPVATEWTQTVNIPSRVHRCRSVQCHECPRGPEPIEACSRYDGTEHRWPSGKVGEGDPEFRRVEQAADVTPPRPPAHVHLRELPPGHKRNANGEQAWRACSRCHAVLPAAAGVAIALGTLDCPSCGWHAGRCEHCHGLLVPSYVVGERDHGLRHCPQCEGVEP
jgi:hypothetical protein